MYYCLPLGEGDLNYSIKYKRSQLQKMNTEVALKSFHEDMVKTFSQYDEDAPPERTFRWGHIDIQDISISETNGFKLKSDGEFLVLTRNYPKVIRAKPCSWMNPDEKAECLEKFNKKYPKFKCLEYGVSGGLHLNFSMILLPEDFPVKKVSSLKDVKTTHNFFDEHEINETQPTPQTQENDCESVFAFI